MKRRTGIILQLSVFVFIFTFSSCAILKTLENIKRLQFKLGTVDNIRLSGISIQGKTKLEDFNTLDALKLVQAFSAKRMPVQFTLNVIASNPNNGGGGYPRTDISLKSFPWKLFIDERETITGNIGQPIVVPGVGEATVFPLSMEVDLYQLFGSQGYKGVVDLALKLAGANNSPLDIKLTARPVVGTPIGDLAYPDEITIVKKEFR